MMYNALTKTSVSKMTVKTAMRGHLSADYYEED